MQKRSTAMIALALLSVTSGAISQSQYRDADPFKPLVGRWKTDAAQFNSSTNDVDYADSASTWTGKMYGTIKETGQIIFKAENGCILSGMASPFTTKGFWTINGRLEGCKLAHFSQGVFGNIRREGNQVVIELKGLPFAIGLPPVAYSIQTRMVGY